MFRRRSVLVIGLVLALVAAIAATFAIRSNSSGKDDVNAENIAANQSKFSIDVAGNSGLTIVAPAVPAWWSVIGKLMPYDSHVADTSIEGLPVTGIAFTMGGFSADVRGEEKSTSPINRIAYLSTANEDDAITVAGYLRFVAPGGEYRTVERSENVVAVSASVPNLADAFVNTQRLQGNGEGQMVIDQDKLAAAFAGQHSAEYQKKVESVFVKGLGLSAGTVWSATSTNGSNWNGSFIKGGYASSNLDQAALATELADFEGSADSATSSPQLSAFFDVVKNDHAEGKTVAKYSDLDLDGHDSVASFDKMGFLYVLTGQSTAETQQQIEYQIDGDQMSLEIK